MGNMEKMEKILRLRWLKTHQKTAEGEKQAYFLNKKYSYMHVCWREAKNSLFPPDTLFTVEKIITCALGEHDPGSAQVWRTSSNFCSPVSVVAQPRASACFHISAWITLKKELTNKIWTTNLDPNFEPKIENHNLKSKFVDPKSSGDTTSFKHSQACLNFWLTYP